MLTKLIDYFIIAEYNKTEESSRRARLTVGVYLIVALFALNYTLLSLYIGYWGGLLSQVPLLIITLICLFLYKWRISPTTVAFVFFTEAIISISIAVYLSGGFKSFIIPWLATTPIVALLVSGKRMGLYALFGQIVMLVIFYILDLNGIIASQRYMIDFPNSFILLCQIGLILLLYIIAIVFENGKTYAMSMLTDKNDELIMAIEKLKSTQEQLVQAEKLASLGQLTAGIAHEIQNPLNFVNNFSEVNTELLAEMELEIDKGNFEEAKEIASEIKANEQKITFHGKRADNIVKGMLMHSRTNSGEKEKVDVNALANEYLRLSYQGLRAKNKSFNAKFVTDFDETIGKVSVIPQDIGRVFLNLITNSFYSVTEKKNLNPELYEPTVWVSTLKLSETIEICIKDNGIGIPQKVLDKIFQPFFTTKPTGKGTGLGLSLSYDIVKRHGGEIRVNSLEGEGAEFIISLPV